MTSNDQKRFPNDRDLELRDQAEQVSQFADSLVAWAGEHAAARAETDDKIDDLDLYALRRLASHLCRASETPAAAAVYGASQVGKSLFMGRVLEPADERDSPLGLDHQLPPPAYIRELSFGWDINPQCGAYEATALVTRFTTKERFDETALPEYSVKIRALTRAEWLRVLARGFRSECQQQEDVKWKEGQLRALFEEVCEDHPAETVDRAWRIDLLDTYAYLHKMDKDQYVAEESLFNSFLSKYPLTPSGYVEIAGRMFWDSQRFPALTTLFNDVCRFLDKVTAGDRDGILVHWGAVKFLLDSQRAKAHTVSNSKWMKSVAWSDFKDSIRDGWYVIDYKPGCGGPSEDQSIIQSAMLEMIVPVVPSRLKSDWREVIDRMDLLDLPGMKAGGVEGEGGAKEVKTVAEKMNIVKRGKVFYLIDRYLEERQIQTMLLLIRGGGLEVRQLLQNYVNKWGKARYGEERWPTALKPEDSANPSLFIGLTGIDEEFREHDEPNEYLYENRLNQLVHETLYDVTTDFGGDGQPFTNIYPIRYPGTWDSSEERRRTAGPEKWERARDIFIQTKLVKAHVENAGAKWDVAMRDNDGGLSLICKGFVACTNSTQKQDALAEQIKQVRVALHELAKSWYCDPSANADRENRQKAADTVLSWLDDEKLIYDRVHALQTALCFDDGDAMEIAEFAENPGLEQQRRRPESVSQRFPPWLRNFLLQNWSRHRAKNRWNAYTTQYAGGAPWLSAEDFNEFSRYLGDYLCTDKVFDDLSDRLLNIVTLSIRDAEDRRHAQREYVQVILNDFILNPGPGDDRGPEGTGNGKDGVDGEERDYGLMEPFLRRWQRHLVEALTSAAGAHVTIPAGNAELKKILDKK